MSGTCASYFNGTFIRFQEKLKKMRKWTKILLSVILLVVVVLAIVLPIVLTKDKEPIETTTYSPTAAPILNNNRIECYPFSKLNSRHHEILVNSNGN